MTSAADHAHAAVADLLAAGLTVATAESLTGGLVGAALTAVPGSSAVYRGGIIAYATDLKASLLDVSEPLLQAYGPVHAQVALGMASGAASRCGADLGVATTGVAGPEPQGGQPVGRVHVAVAGPAQRVIASRVLDLDGDRRQIRDAVVVAALELVRAVVAGLEHGDTDMRLPHQ